MNRNRANPPVPSGRPRQTISFHRRSLTTAKAVGSYLPALTTKAFKKYGFSAASLIMDWPAIVGADLAQCTAPERLKWPRVAEPDEDEAAAAPARRGATLIVRVDSAKALNVQYGSRQIIERINAYFGYAAVAELRLVQAPIAAPPARTGARQPAPPLTQEVAAVAHSGLRAALARLGGEIKAGR